jgi:hypothetical protein
MASNAHAKADRVVMASNSAPSSVESFAGNGNGDLAINLNRGQWQTIVCSLAIASGQVAVQQRDYEQVFAYAGLCNTIGARLGLGQQTAAVGDLPPPERTRAASA